jgi:hypothetical protein
MVWNNWDLFHNKCSLLHPEGMLSLAAVYSLFSMYMDRKCSGKEQILGSRVALKFSSLRFRGTYPFAISGSMNKSKEHANHNYTEFPCNYRNER